MPLNNVMQRGMRLPRIGTIRKGMQVPVIDQATKEPKRNGKGEIVMRPKEMPHFVFGIDPAQEAEVFGVLKQAYGTDKITELNVFLAKPDAHSNFSFWMEAYNFNQLIARSDERVVTYLFDTETNQTLIKDGVITEQSTNPNSPAGKLVAKYKVGEVLPYTNDMIVSQTKGENAKGVTFKAVGRLEVVIKELKRLATFTLKTGGYWYDIPSIYTTVEICDQIANITGRGANTIPLKLRRVEREHTFTDKDGSKKKKVSYDVELEVKSAIVAGLLETYDSNPFAQHVLEASNSGQPTLPAIGGPEPMESYADNDDTTLDATVVEDPQPLVVNSQAPKPMPKDELIDPLGVDPVKFAARQWNITESEAAKTIGGRKDKFQNPMSKNLFKKIVTEGVDRP